MSSDDKRRLGDYGPLPARPDKGFKVINVRGTNGGGKGYLIEKLTEGIDVANPKRIKVYGEGDSKCHVTDCDTFYLIGRYQSACGGMDSIKDMKVVAPIVQELIKEKTVVMEGLLWSGVFGQSYELTTKLREQGTDMLWLFLDTEVETCIQNVLKRRIALGDTRPLSTSALIRKYQSHVRIQKAAYRVGATCYTGGVDYLLPLVRSALSGGLEVSSGDEFKPLKPCTVPEGIVDDHAKIIQRNVQEDSPLAAFFA